MIDEMQQYIVQVKNVIPLDLCDDVLIEYEKSNEWENAVVGTFGDNEARNCDTIKISQPYVIQDKTNRQELDNKLWACAAQCIKKYNKKFNYANVHQDTGYELLRYKTGGFYTEHTDSFIEAPRLISCSFALNDNYEGGEFAFFNKKLKYKLDKGDALMFPSTFTYPHQILPVTKGVRYSIITWFN